MLPVAVRALSRKVRGRGRETALNDLATHASRAALAGPRWRQSGHRCRRRRIRWALGCVRSNGLPRAHLVLFEPQPTHTAALDRFQTQHPDAHIVRSAVGAERGSSLFDAADPFGGVLQQERTASSIAVSVVTLDEVLRSAKPPFVVKLDTHGVESEILAGSEQTLRRSVAWIVEAYNHRITPNCMLFWELCEYMAQAGFRPADLVDVLHRPHDGTLWQMDLLFIRSDWDGFDYLGYT